MMPKLAYLQKIVLLIQWPVQKTINFASEYVFDFNLIMGIISEQFR